METAVITTGGLGTRLLTCTKNNPKTMLPLYKKSIDQNPDPLLRPLIEIIFNNLYDHGFRRFCFIVGEKTKESIINHLMPDIKYLSLLKKRNNDVDKRFIKTLNQLYRKFKNCEISWISQNTPMGFGHALLSSAKFVGRENFLLQAGDSFFPNYDFLQEYITYFQKSKNAYGSLLLQRKRNLSDFGVAKVRRLKNESIVLNVEEKPKKPKGNMAILPIYLFRKEIFEALKETQKGHNNELQVTDAIKTMLKKKRKVIVCNFGNNKWFDIGTPHRYFQALKYSYNTALKL